MPVPWIEHKVPCESVTWPTIRQHKQMDLTLHMIFHLFDLHGFDIAFNTLYRLYHKGEF